MRPAAAAMLLVLGCSREPPGPHQGTAGAHAADAGCATWTVLEAGTCRARPWVLPTPADAIGEAGARLHTLAIDGTGMGLAGWNVALPGRAAVGVGEELGPGVWAVRDPARALAGGDASPVVAGGPDGAAMVTWVHGGGGDGVVAAERDRWGRWREPGPGEVRSFPSSGIEPWVAVSPTGEWIHVWCQGTRIGRGTAVARRTGSAGAWERPAGAEDVLSPPILFTNQPQIAVNARGDALLAWYQSPGGPLMTYVSERRGPAGAFSRPGLRDHLSAPGAPVDSDPVANPKPALGPSGEAAVVWVQENGAGATPVYLATRDPAGVWTRPRDLADAFSEPAGVALDARVAFGTAGELFVVWTQRGAVHGARRSRSGRWTRSGRAPARLSSPGSVAHSPTLAVGPEGAAIVAWIERVGSGEERVVARRTGEDRADWEAAEVLSSPSTRPVGPPVAAMGPGDRALVGWSAGSPQDARIVFARVD